ncbi:enoyl-CoA hydratase/isomerase family protein [Nakamurella leprariae]|uniref:Enoyl-CoA hydratase/isomerase family protein n=1 Tax=Nakamurella leprariae TaxID=2803911 RepID=A0A938YKB3_9ACTN|nr:enoyl-CoA hydratase/isomerase family protein [Nakamurella leprariae]MBM9469443.1 enoyl-CoA hydratase/isomerase family protein [Nakamurella leprariae]
MGSDDAAEEVASALTVSVGAGVATVVVDAGPVNLMTVPVYLELAAVIDRLAADGDVRVVVFRSANPEWFIAHFDVAAILEFPSEPTAPPTELSTYHLMCESLRRMPKATIAVIEGRVGGGGSEVALSCDMRFAGPDAVFNQPEVALGIIPGGTGTVRLPRLIGRSRALEAILGCDDIDAVTAERWGWVNRVLPADELGPFVDRLAARLASFPPHAVAAAKASVVRAEVGVVEDLLAESHAFSGTLADPSTRAAMTNFLARGGQTPEGERRLGELAAELG